MKMRSLLEHLASRIFSPAALARGKYTAFKAFLEWDHTGHRLMTRLEKIYHDEEHVDFCTIRAVYEELVQALSRMIENLEAMAPFSYRNLSRILSRIDATIRACLQAESASTDSPYILGLGQVPPHAESVVGGKAANLSRLSRELDLPVPTGFVITSSAFNVFCSFNGLRENIEKRLTELDMESASSLERTSKEIVSSIRNAPLPPFLEDAIAEAYLAVISGQRCAVRSSAVGEDAQISFAGQYRTILDVSGDGLIDAYKEVIAGKYSPTALSYRIRHGLLDEETPMAVLVLEMIHARASGVMYTRDPLDSSQDTVTIYSTLGVGEPLVGGAATPDVIQVSKEEGHQIAKGEAASLDHEGARRLAAIGLRLEAHFGSAQDVEWCMDKNGGLYLLQSRPLGIGSADKDACRWTVPEVPNPVLLEGGEKAASGVAMGRVAFALSPSGLKHVPYGSVLVASTASPQFAQLAGKVKAVITDIGSVAGHFASVARESGIPTLVNTRSATKVLKPGQIITVDADRRRVFAGVAEELLAACGQRQKGAAAETPVRRRLRKILDGVSPLNLIDPKSPDFSARSCKTLHDLLRFSHEKAIEEMFSLSGGGKRTFRGARKLICDIPVLLYVLDLGGGIKESISSRSELHAEDLLSFPFSAMWKGLTGLKGAWSSDTVHFDWGAFSQFSLGEGIVSLDSQLLGSFALVSPDYMNANIRFGFHFAVIDTLITLAAQDNYISLRFEGGGGDFEGKRMRAVFLARVLENHGFQVDIERDSVSAVFESAPPEISAEKLELVGRLLAFTPYLDMKLKDLSEVGNLVALFGEKSGAVEEEAQKGRCISEHPGSIQSQTDDGLSSYRPTWITDQLAVGHAPMSYEDLQSIKRQGINAIVNLCAEYCDLCQIEKDYGFDVYYLPVPDDEAPDMQEMDRALAWLDEAIYLEKKVLLHCRLGIGRTGTFLRSYFIRRGFGPELIEERLRRVHSHPTSYSQWRLLRKYGKQAERLTVREPSLEAERLVDLSSYFEEYEELCRMADAAFEQGTSQSSFHPRCGKDTSVCCKDPFHLQFVEAVYLRHHLTRELSREDRLVVTRHAAALSRRARRNARKEPGLVLIPDATADLAEGIGLVDDQEYRCPLYLGERCILFDHRPLRCRAFDLTKAKQESRFKDIEEISRRLFFALNGRFLQGRSLIFPVADVISGKYIEDYFILLSETEKHAKGIGLLSCHFDSPLRHFDRREKS